MSHHVAIQTKAATENGKCKPFLPNVYVKPCGNYTNMEKYNTYSRAFKSLERM